MTDFDELHFPTAPVTDSDPIIAEINIDEWNAAPGPMNVHLSDAPKVADLLEAAKRSAHTSKEMVEYCYKYNLSPSPLAIEESVVTSLVAAIRAIEPEWSP